MSQGFVADASVGVAWVHPAQASPQTQALLQALYDGAIVHVPALWPLEVANALVVLVRRTKLSGAECADALGALQGLAVKVDHEASSMAFTKLSHLAAEYRLTVYLELAQRKKLALACKDGPLRDAAKRGRVRVL